MNILKTQVDLAGNTAQCSTSSALASAGSLRFSPLLRAGCTAQSWKLKRLLQHYRRVSCRKGAARSLHSRFIFICGLWITMGFSSAIPDFQPFATQRLWICNCSTMNSFICRLCSTSSLAAAKSVETRRTSVLFQKELVLPACLSYA